MGICGEGDGFICEFVADENFASLGWEFDAAPMEGFCHLGIFVMLGDLDEIKSDKKCQEDEGKNGNDNFEAIFEHGGFGFWRV